MRRAAARRTGASSASSPRAWQRRLGWYPGDWIWPVAVLPRADRRRDGRRRRRELERKQRRTPTRRDEPPSPSARARPADRAASRRRARCRPRRSRRSRPGRSRPRPGAPSTGSLDDADSRTRTRSPSGPRARAATRTCSSRCPSRAAARTQSPGPAGRSGAGLADVGVLALVAVLEPPSRLLRRLLRDLRAPRPRRAAALSTAHAKGFPTPTRPGSPVRRARCKPGPAGHPVPSERSRRSQQRQQMPHFVTRPRNV